METTQLTEKNFVFPRFGNALRDIADFLHVEAANQKNYFFLWFPVFIAIGIGIYFSLPVEPPLILGVFGFLVNISWLVIARARLKIAACLVALVMAGFLSGQIRTHIVHTPILQKDVGPTMVSGTIEEIEDLGDEAGARLVLSGVEIEELAKGDTPRKVRVKIWKDEGLAIGQRIELLAKLRRPPTPVIPGGFDFQRYLYFKQIGAVGFSFSEATILKDNPQYGFSRVVENLRHNISQEIEDNMVYPQAPVAMALMTGRKTAISREDSEAIRNAGLAHMLAISGLHMGLFSGVVFFFVRFLMALIPGFALKHPIKKYAAVIAIMGAFFYMCLAGATVPTQRALLMTSIVFLAIILDRSPLSLRLVAFAAIAVLLVFPESLLSASFHMSFGAVTGLILFYEWISPVWSSWHRQAGILRRAALYFVGVCMTTVVATIATAPFALFHFNQFAVYSLLSNAIAMPILAFIVMPSVVGSIILMPLGMEVLAFYPMDIGIYGILEVAHFVEALPHSVAQVPSWPLSALVSMVTGFLILTLWKGRLRWLSAIFFAAFVWSIIIYNQIDILISSSYSLISYRASDGTVHISNKSKEKFVSENWAHYYGYAPEELVNWPREGGDNYMSCGEQGCRFKLKGYNISYITRPIVGDEECAEQADIILSSEPFEGCEDARVIDFFDAYRNGAHAIWLEEGGPVIKATENMRGNRPWSKFNEDF